MQELRQQTEDGFAFLAEERFSISMDSTSVDSISKKIKIFMGKNSRTRKEAQPLEVLAALAEGPGSGLAHTWWLITICNCSSKGSDTYFSPLHTGWTSMQAGRALTTQPNEH